MNLGPIKRGRGLTIPEQEMEKKRKRIIAEILMSEEDYGKDLAILYKVKYSLFKNHFFHYFFNSTMLSL